MKLLLLFSYLISFSALSFVQVNPVRFHVNESKFSHFTVRNTQSKSVSVDIENKYFAMQPDGKMIPDNSKATDELKKILFTPKSFVLGPGEKQVVRFFVKDTLAGAELRTYAHLLTEVKTELPEKTDTSGPSMSLTPKVAVAIPVIFRVKTFKENINISEEKFLQKESDCIMNAKWMNLHHSSYINFEALNDKGEIIFQLNGISNYLKNYDWNLVIAKTKCDKIKRIKIFDVDNDAYIVNKEVKP